MTPAKSLTLYEIGSAYERIYQALVESDGVLTPELETELDALGPLEGTKVDGVCAVALEFTAARKKYAELAKLFDQRSRAAAAAETRLLERLRLHMARMKVRELRGPTFNPKLQMNGGLRALELLGPIDDLPDTFTQPQPRIVDGEAVRAYLTQVHGDGLWMTPLKDVYRYPVWTDGDGNVREDPPESGTEEEWTAATPIFRLAPRTDRIVIR